MKLTTTLVTAASCLLLASVATAQDAPKTNFVTHATTRMAIPDDAEEEDYWKMQQEYFDKVIKKSTLVLHYSIYRHAWGSEGATVVETMEFSNWDDIDKFNKVERESLEKAAWPDENARKAFMKKWHGFESPYHHDEIYTISLSMRK